jgi:hypothetical protein
VLARPERASKPRPSLAHKPASSRRWLTTERSETSSCPSSVASYSRASAPARSDPRSEGVRLAPSRRAAAQKLAVGLVALVVVAPMSTASASAHFSARKAIWGPWIHGRTSVWPIYKRLGVGIYEDALDWSFIARRRPRHPRDARDPAYGWPVEVTRAVSEAARYHIRVALMLTRSPSWANGGRRSRWAPRHSADFADFAIAAARRYPSVHLWMIWGEPSRAADFQPLATVRPGTKLTSAQAQGPHTYARLLDAAYHALKAVSRKNLVIGGMTFTGGNIDTQQWIENLVLPDGGPPHLDLYGHNPFSYREPELGNPPSLFGEVDFSDLGRLARFVDRYLGRGRHIPLFLSEWTIPTRPDHEFPFWVDPPAQARWIDAAFSIVHRWPRIYALGWIHLYDDRPGGGSQGGLLGYRGKPKPGFFAFERG